MSSQEVLTPILEKARLLMVIVGESPYLSKEARNAFEVKIQKLLKDIKEGNISFSEAEKVLLEADGQAAREEIESLIGKIKLLNSSSPRIAELKAVVTQLSGGGISPADARRAIFDIMQSL